MTLQVRRVKVSTSVHATEDEGKVMKALRTVFPPDVRNILEFKRSEYRGHWGNTIVVIETEIRDYPSALKTIRWIAEKLSELDKRLLRFELRDRVDKSLNLYLRFNKQAAYQGRLEVDNGDDVIKVVIGFHGSRQLQDLSKYLSEIGLMTGE